MIQTNVNLVLALLIFATCCTCITVNVLDEAVSSFQLNQNDVGRDEIGRHKEIKAIVFDSSISLDKNTSSDEDPQENIRKINSDKLSANELGNVSWPEDSEPIGDETENALKRVKRCGGGGRRRRNNNNDDNDDGDDGDANRSRRSRRARRRRARRARRARARKAREARKRAKKSSTITTTITTRIKRAIGSQSLLHATDTDEKGERSITVSRTSGSLCNR